MPAGTPWSATTVDISRSGVGLLCSGAFVSGQAVVVAFRLGACQERVEGRVIRFSAEPDGNRIGIEFLTPISRAQNPALSSRLDRL
jgi:hypothetical protein